ncbi:hypothetical protein MSMTP_0840 [Methanosarcina sp. MTP4]|uniref:hypothetical protein n=1 Tax=Methanosarcina sp. MTP4 TaxID=1434100 RepID=UPI0006154BF2|nr:hypothetical protein [Methanosarcina sp. MTP4]AKB24309.1 hypothetical protein MSMTP_0840 [Methanosarcina sp. MTP4]
MDIGIGLSIINFIEFIIQKQKNSSYKNKLREALFIDFEPEVQNLSKAYDELLLNVYTLMGAYILGLKLNPMNPACASDEIIDRINSSYSNLEAHLLQVTKTMRIHKDQFKLLYESDPELQIQFEDLVNSVDDEKNIDFLYLGNKKSLVDNFFGKDFDTSFIEELNQKTEAISFSAQASEIEWIKKFNNYEIKEIISDKEFLGELVVLFQKYYLRNMNTKKKIK